MNTSSRYGPDLERELREMRPTPRPEFVADLDTRAATGFPSADRSRRLRLPRVLRSVRISTPRQAVAPAGIAALTAIAVATAVIAVSEGGRDVSQHAASPDMLRDSPEVSSAGKLGSGGRSGGVDAEAFGASLDAEVVARSAIGNSAPPALKPFRGRLSEAPALRHRAVERGATIVLGADPDEVRPDAARVFGAVRAVHGVVLSSSIRDGGEGTAGARFELLVPSANLGDALAELSSIATVRTRRDATRDITGPTVGAKERLEDSQARVKGLLAQLADADTTGERAAVEAQLHAERRHAAVLRERLGRLRRRADLARVSVTIATGAPAKDGAAQWGVGDGIDGGGRILAIAAGVTVIGLAAIVPLALAVLLAWLARRAWIRRGRARALAH